MIPSIFILLRFFSGQSQAQNSVATSSNIRTSRAQNGVTKYGEFITLQGMNGFESRIYAAGPEDASAGILIVQDFFGITTAKETVERLGALGYRTIAVDLYFGKSASSNDSARYL